MSSKRTNKKNRHELLVSSGNQNLPTNATPLFTAGTAMNLANGQISIVNQDSSNATYNIGDNVNADLQAVGVNSIKIVQGTPASSNITMADNAWQYGDLTHLETGLITRANIRSVATTLPNLGQRSAEILEPTTVLDNAQYGFHLRVSSYKVRRDYGYNDNVQFISYETPDYTALGTVSPLDHLLQNLLVSLNYHSRLVGAGRPYNFGNGDFVAFGLNLAGGAGGTAIGALTAGSVVPMMIVDGYTYNYTLDATDVQTMNNWIANNANVTAATEIIALNLTTAGAAANVDAMAVIGLDTPYAIAYDEIKQIRTKVELNPTDEFVINNVTSTVLSYAEEPTNIKRNIEIEWGNYARMFRGNSPQVTPQGEFFPVPNSYITSDYYTTTAIDYYGLETTLTTIEHSNFIASIILPATVTVGTVATGVTYATSATNTVTNLNTVFGNWFTAINSTGLSNIEFLGAATQAAPFV